MALKNFLKIKLENNKKTYWKLYKIDGTEFVPFSEWTIFIQDKYSFQTRDKYSQVVSKFLDFLVEVDIFEKVITKFCLKNAIEDYKKLLSKGKSITDKKLFKIAELLDFNELSSSSWSNNIAAINSFLDYSLESEEDNREYLLIKKNIKLSPEFKNVLFELENKKELNQFQKNAIKQRSFIANLYRTSGRISVSSRIKSNHTYVSNNDFKNLDFPALSIPKLLSHTSCFRDKAIYSLLAGTGIRSSEALTLTWDMIDIENQKIYIKNLDENDNNEDIRFKGRDTNMTFFIPELRHIFFSALYSYQLTEASSNVNHNFVFQFLKGNKYGEAYYTVSRQSFIKEFKKTVLRANISSSLSKETIFTPHSLRHFYGVYMLNHIPLENKFGFTLEEVQRMMGHKSIEITKKYARRPDEYIQSQLLYAEMKLDNKEISIDNLNKLFKDKFLDNNQ